MEDPITTAGASPHGTSRRRIDLSKVCKDYGISTYSFQTAADLMKKVGLEPEKSSGYAFITDGQPVILFDKERSVEEVRFTVAHELGHILLGHLSYRMKNREMPQYAEQEADVFAATLIVNDILCQYGMEVRT